MQKWSAFLLSGTLVLALVVWLFIQPLDSQANTTTEWHATFYDNVELSGEPVLERSDRFLNFNWSMDAPAPDIPTDYFSARWDGNFEFDEGEWLFSAGADDGIRLWVDERLVIDQWAPSGTFIIHTNTITLDEGNHRVRVEYYDAEGLAGIDVKWEPSQTPASAVINNDPAPELDPQTNPTPIPADAPLAHVATGVLNVRTGPGIQYTRIDQIYLYQRYPLLGQNSDGAWYKISLKDGRTGWVAARYIYRTGAATIAVIADAEPVSAEQVFDSIDAVSLARLNVRPDPSTDQDPLGVIPYQRDIKVFGRSNDSIWYLVEWEELRGWVFAPYVDLQGFPVYDLPYATE